MRISKLYLVLCVAASCGSPATLHADDNPDQAAARAALEAKMREVNGLPASTNIQTAPVTSAQPARNSAATTPAGSPPARAQQAQPPAVEVTPSGATMRRPATRTPSAERPSMAGAPAVTPASSSQGLFAPVPPPSGSTPMGTTPQNASWSTNVRTLPPAYVSPAFARSPQNTNAFYPGRKLGLEPIHAPPLPITPKQQAQLQALLEKYDANAITPEQYQAERAKILAEHK